MTALSRVCEPSRSAPLSDLQYAYLLGELGDFDLGGPALFYEEYRCEPFDVGLFAAALYRLMRRHEMLRATFDPGGLLTVREDLAVPLGYRLLRGQPAAACERVLAESRAELYERATPLRSCAPFAVRIFALDDRNVVQVYGRLLAIDGFSGEIFAQELRALLAGEQLPPLGYTYREYRREIERRKDTPAYATARRYWLDRLDTLPPAPELPGRRPDGEPDRNLVRRTFRLPPQRWKALAQRVRRNRLTPTMAIAAAFSEVLRHWSKRPDFTINIMYGDRAAVHPDVNRIIGNFSSTVLLQCSPLAEDRLFTDRARRLSRQLMADLEHSAFSGVSVIRELNSRSSNVRGALMPVVFTSMLGVGEESTGVFLEHLGWQREAGRVRTPQVSFDHQVFVADDALVVTWDTADDLYPPGLVEDMLAGYERLLTALADTDEAWHGTAFALTPPVQLAVRATVNDTAAPLPPATLHGLFLARAEQQPDRPAVLAGGATVSYGQLRQRAFTVAAALARAGVAPGDLVGVLCRRGADQLAALLGVQLGGAAYVPIAADWPHRRRAQVAAAAGIRALLTGPGLDLDGLPGTVAVLPLAPLTDGDGDPAATVPVATEDEALAYVIFTSGTTGTPKGVMISHRGAVNTVLDINERFGVGPDDRVLAVSDYTFDLSVYDVFGLLAAGGAVVVPEPDQAREVVYLHRLALSAGVTVWNSVPAYLAMFLEFIRSGARAGLPALRLAMVSGDWVPTTIGQALAAVAPQARCVALGGATEASIWSNYYPVPARVPAGWASVPYGYPLRNQRYHVLDRDLADRPDWVAGELYIAGTGLALGYLGSPELTAAAFRTHPGTGERIYRTGDWARYWPDGTLEFLGRDDPQVKVNGFRVELGEIEAALQAHERVSDAAVVARTGARGVSLVAFVAAEADSPAVLAGELAEHLAGTLPSYMVPPVIDVAPRLPLTANGKVDRHELGRRAATAVVTRGPAAAPMTATEQRLARIWAELLEVARVGRDDDFFAAGGSSLHAAQLMNRLEHEFGIRLPLASLYTSATVAKLAVAIDSPSQPREVRCLVTLADGDRPVVLLVHPVGGDLLCYRDLVAALPGRAVLGLHSVDPAVGGPADTVPAMAQRYLAEALPALGHGRVHLVGWSMGGVIAYEMARRMRAAGRDTRVVMVDPWVRRPGCPPPDDETLVRAFLTNLCDGELDLSGIGPVPGEPAGDTLRRLWRTTADRLPAAGSLTFDELWRTYRIFAANTRALLAYQPVPDAANPAELVQAAGGLDGPALAYLAPLATVAGVPAGITCRRLPGNHFSVLATGSGLAELIRPRS